MQPTISSICGSSGYDYLLLPDVQHIGLDSRLQDQYLRKHRLRPNQVGSLRFSFDFNLGEEHISTKHSYHMTKVSRQLADSPVKKGVLIAHKQFLENTGSSSEINLGLEFNVG